MLEQVPTIIKDIWQNTALTTSKSQCPASIKKWVAMQWSSTIKPTSMKKTQPIKTCPQITEMLKLADKDFKISIINMLDMKHIKKVKEKKTIMKRERDTKRPKQKS